MSKSKLNKMKGKARIAINSYTWKDFNLKPGCAYGIDNQGNLFASFGTSAKRYGDSAPKKDHIIVFFAINQDDRMPIKHRKTVWGPNSRAIGRRPIIAPSGNYARPWGYNWAPRQVHVKSELGREITSKIADWFSRN